MADKLSLGAITVIAASAVAVVVVVIIILLCCLYRRYRSLRNSAMMTLGDGRVPMRGISVKRSVLNTSYRKSDDEEGNVRPVTIESSQSFKLNADALRTRDNTGRQSFDIPFSALRSMQAEENIAKRQSLMKTRQDRNIVRGYGEVTMKSPGTPTTERNSGVRISNEIPTVQNTGSGVECSQEFLIPVETGPSPITSTKRYTLRAEQPLPDRLSGLLDPTNPSKTDLRHTERSPNSRPNQTRSDPRISHIIKFPVTQPGVHSGDRFRSQPEEHRPDSFRQSLGVDLGADYNRAWKMSSQGSHM